MQRRNISPAGHSHDQPGELENPGGISLVVIPNVLVGPPVLGTSPSDKVLGGLAKTAGVSRCLQPSFQVSYAPPANSPGKALPIHLSNLSALAARPGRCIHGGLFWELAGNQLHQFTVCSRWSDHVASCVSHPILVGPSVLLADRNSLGEGLPHCPLLQIGRHAEGLHQRIIKLPIHRQPLQHFIPQSHPLP